MLFKCSMYYLSFAPLWASIIFMEIMSWIHGATHIGTEIISLIVIPIAFVMAFREFRKELALVTKKEGLEQYSLDKAKEEKLATAEFLATFIIPLFAFEFTTWEGMLLFVFFFFVFGYLCVKHNYLCTNIVLDLCKYRVYDCDLTDTSGVKVQLKIISTREIPIAEGEFVYLKALNNEYSFESYVS